MSCLPHSFQVKGKAAIDVLGARLGKSGGALAQQGLVVACGSILTGAPVLATLFSLVRWRAQGGGGGLVRDSPEWWSWRILLRREVCKESRQRKNGVNFSFGVCVCVLCRVVFCFVFCVVFCILRSFCRVFFLVVYLFKFFLFCVILFYFKLFCTQKAFFCPPPTPQM